MHECFCKDIVRIASEVTRYLFGCTDTATADSFCQSAADDSDSGQAQHCSLEVRQQLPDSPALPACPCSNCIHNHQMLDIKPISDPATVAHES